MNRGREWRVLRVRGCAGSNAAWVRLQPPGATAGCPLHCCCQLFLAKFPYLPHESTTKSSPLSISKKPSCRRRHNTSVGVALAVCDWQRTQLQRRGARHNAGTRCCCPRASRAHRVCPEGEGAVQVCDVQAQGGDVPHILPGILVQHPAGCSCMRMLHARVCNVSTARRE